MRGEEATMRCVVSFDGIGREGGDGKGQDDAIQQLSTDR